MIININNNYFQLKEPNKKIKSKNNQLIVKKSIRKQRNINLGERKLLTSYNTLSSTQNRIKPLINQVLSPIKNENIFISKNNNNYYLNSSKNNKNRINRNVLIKNNISNNKLIKTKTLDNDNNICKTNYIFGNKLKISKNKNIKDKFKIKGINETNEKTKMSVNRKIVINYLKNNERKKINRRPFNTIESVSMNNLSNNKNSEINYNISEKNKALSLLNNPITFKINRNIIHKEKTNSMQIKKKNYLLSSINITKEKIPRIKLELDLNNNEKFDKKILYNKTQGISDIEFNINNKNNKKKISSLNNLKKVKKMINSEIRNRNKNINEIKEKYHIFLREKIITHNSYDTQNKLNLFNKYKTLNNDNYSITSSINSINILKKKNHSPLTNKKYILSPNEKIKGIINNYIKTPIQFKYTITKKALN